MLHNPCFECKNHYGREYSSDCDKNCIFAKSVNDLHAILNSSMATDNSKLMALVKYIFEYGEKVKQKCIDRDSDGKFHSIGMMDGESFALDNIMNKIKELEIIDSIKEYE